MLAIDYTYDIETYFNVFTACFLRPSDSARWQFEISPRRDDGVALFQFLQQVAGSGGRGVGYNNEAFDYPILHLLIERGGNVSAYELWMKKNEIFATDNRWEHVVRNPLFPQVDLFKIHHFDNAARSTSLKMLENNMRSMNIKDLPFDPDQPLALEYINYLLTYNWHDVDETDRFRLFSVPMIEFREKLVQEYDRQAFMNYNDPKIGEQVFISKMEQSGLQCFEYINGRRVPRQTWRTEIALNQCVFPWIQFKQPAFQAVMQWFQSQVITQTKGVFSELHENQLGPVGPYTTMRERQTTDVGQPLAACEWYDTKKNGNRYIRRREADTLNVVVNGFQFDFGAGGIHGSIESTVVRSDEHYQIIDLDVASYYPNLAIANRLYPAHLGDAFCDIYKQVFDERRTHKKGTPENAMLKLALNGVYGKSNSQFSCFYDPAYTMSITINGQLLLCLLAEWLMDIPGLSMIQVNTDGLTVRVPREHEPRVAEVAKAWEQHTGLELEDVHYSNMYIRDVNHYMAQTVSGKVKRKGAYCYETPHDDPYTGELTWNKNHSHRVVMMAAEAALVRGESIRNFITNHDDIFDFCICTKVPRSMRLELRYPDGTVQPCENITRYYVTNHGGSLFKIMPPLPGKTEERTNSIQAGWQVQPVNDINADYRGDICYEYYIKEAEKLVHPLLT